jgi:hypothetical protein
LNKEQIVQLAYSIFLIDRSLVRVHYYYYYYFQLLLLLVAEERQQQQQQ